MHPYRLLTVGTNMTMGVPLKPGIDAWNADSYAHTNGGWNQGVMNAAMLGLTDKASSMVLQRSKTGPAKGYRFPGFAPHSQARHHHVAVVVVVVVVAGRSLRCVFAIGVCMYV